MDFMATPLGDEVKRVIASGQGNPDVFLEATIHTLFGDIPVMKVLNYDIVRDYSQQYSDEISLVVIIPGGQSAYRIMPSRNQLEITLTGSPLSKRGKTNANNKNYASERFRAVLKEANDPTLEVKTKEFLAENTMDIQDLTVLEFQLFSKAMEQFTVLPCGGIYRKTSVADLIRTLLLQESKNLQVEDDYKPLGVDMVEPVDTTKREHIVIPHGTKVYDAPGYIHRHCGGVYSAGLSYYYQDNYWYVYPTYDYKKFEEASRQLVIVQVPEFKLPNLSYTYMTEGSVVTIVATGELSFNDTSDLTKRATGNGVRFADASRLFADGVEVLDNKAVVSRGKLNNEFVSSQQKAGFNNVVMSQNRITSNNLYEASKLASKEGVQIQLVWENSDQSLILPGMKTKIHYYKDGEIKQINAIVMGTHTSTSYEGSGLVTGRFNRNTAILLFAANEAQQ